MSLWKGFFLILSILFYFGQAQDSYILLTRNSFSGPYTDSVPHWRTIGDAKVPFPSSPYVELTPMQQDKKGGIWNLVTLKPIDWEVKAHISFGPQSGPQIAAGIAIWLTKDKESVGTAFGSNKQFQGLSVIFDTYDNNGDGNSPLLYGVWNDGQASFDHFLDNNQKDLLNLGSCRVTRNPSSEHIVKIQYKNKKLTVSILQNYNSNSNSEFQDCFTAPIQIPRGYYLGISSNTGGFIDNHRVHSFEVRSISGEAEQTLEDGPTSEPVITKDNAAQPNREVPSSEPNSEPNSADQQRTQQEIKQQKYEEERKRQNILMEEKKRAAQKQGEQQQHMRKAQNDQQHEEASLGYEHDLKYKIEQQITKHIELETAIQVLAQEADDLFAGLETRASTELRELQNKVVLLHPEVELLANTKPSIQEIERNIMELQSALQKLESKTHFENEKMDMYAHGPFYFNPTGTWDKWVWLLVIQSVAIFLFILIQKYRKPVKQSRF
jgi:hypothetical protein